MSATETGAVRSSAADAPADGQRVLRRAQPLGAALRELIGTFMLLFFGVARSWPRAGRGRSQKLLIGLAFGLTSSPPPSCSGTSPARTSTRR
jgi:glycerol uptake facilitator-like aquaporin